MAPKTKPTDLAVFGAAPAFPAPVHVGRPSLPDRGKFFEALNDIFDRNILTNDGPEVRGLEERFRRLTGAEHAVAVSNATLGLQLLARALDLKGRVLMPSFTFVATAHAFKWLGLEPVFCDVDLATHNLDPLQVERHLHAGVSAVVGVHLWGRLCAPLELEARCRQYHVPLIFDAAHATGCQAFGRSAGTFGAAEVFSLHATKVCHSFEGGVITTHDGALAGRLRQMRNFGFSGYDQVDCLGINAKLPEPSAAMGSFSLETLERQRAVNLQSQLLYRDRLAGIPGLKFIDLPPAGASNHHYVVAEFCPPWPATARDVLYDALHAEGVLVRRYFHPGVHRMEPYRRATAESIRLPNTESLCQRVLCFPNGISVGTDVINRICDLTALILAALPAVERQLAQVRTVR